MKKFTLIAATAAVALSASAQDYQTTKLRTADVLDGIEKATIDWIVLDEQVVAQLQADPNYTVNNFGPDDSTTLLYVWSGTYADGPTTVEGVDGGKGYVSFNVGTVGWSGAGFCANAGSPVNTQHFTDETFIHFAYRTDNACPSFCFGILTYDVGTGDNKVSYGAKVAVGTNPNEPTYNQVGAAPTTEWQAVEMKLGDLKKEFPGWDYKTWTNGNYFTFLAGGVAGQNISVGPIYFVTPGSGSALNTIEAEDANAPVVYYNLQGQKVNNPENGIFIRKAGKTVEKVVL